MSDTSTIPERLAQLCELHGIDPKKIQDVMAEPQQAGEPYIVRYEDSYATIDEEDGENELPTYQDVLNHSLALALDTKLLAAVATTAPCADCNGTGRYFDASHGSSRRCEHGAHAGKISIGPSVKVRGNVDEIVVFKAPPQFITDQRWLDLIRSRLPGALVVELNAHALIDEKTKRSWAIQPLGDDGQREVTTIEAPLGYLGRRGEFIFISAPTPKKGTWQKLLHAQLLAAMEIGQIKDGGVIPVVLDAKVQVCRLVGDVS